MLCPCRTVHCIFCSKKPWSKTWPKIWSKIWPKIWPKPGQKSGQKSLKKSPNSLFIDPGVNLNYTNKKIRILRFFLDLSSKVFLVFSFDFAGKNLVERSGIARVSSCQILVRIRLQEAKKFRFRCFFCNFFKSRAFAAT